MGIIRKDYKFLWANKSLLQNSKMLMIGRQQNFLTYRECKKIGIEKQEFAENFFQFFGCKNIESIDYSDYEHPTYTHNFNYPLTNPELLGKYDVVFDGGSTEHIYNPVQAITNYKNLLKVGGYYIGVLPMNNCCNHGFYQFSPELFYRCFAKEFGYMTKCFTYGYGRKYVVDLADLPPNKINNISLWVANQENYIYIIAKKISEIASKTTEPLQSIYHLALWEEKPKGKHQQLTLLQKRYVKIQQTAFRKFLSSITPISIKSRLFNRLGKGPQKLISVKNPIF